MVPENDAAVELTVSVVVLISIVDFVLALVDTVSASTRVCAALPVPTISGTISWNAMPVPVPDPTPPERDKEVGEVFVLVFVARDSAEMVCAVMGPLKLAPVANVLRPEDIDRTPELPLIVSALPVPVRVSPVPANEVVMPKAETMLAVFAKPELVERLMALLPPALELVIVIVLVELSVVREVPPPPTKVNVLPPTSVTAV